MTTLEAITFVRMVLDEPKYEYFGTSADASTVFVDALREAAAIVARTCWNRGDKDALRPIMQEVSGTLDANGKITLPAPYLFIDSVMSNYRGLTSSRWLHTYVDPAVFFRRRHRSPTEGASGISVGSAELFVSRAEYTTIGLDIYATGSTTAPTPNKDIIVTYVGVPAVSATPGDQLPMAEFIHPVICDTAAGILYRKEHPGDDRPLVGTVVDTPGAMYQIIRGGAQ